MTSRVFSVARFGQQKIGLQMGRCVCGVSFKVGLAKAATAGNLMPPNNHDFLVLLALLHSTQLLHFVPMDTFFVNAYHLLQVDFTDGHLTSIEARTSPIYYLKIAKKRQFSQAFFLLNSSKDSFFLPWNFDFKPSLSLTNQMRLKESKTKVKLSGQIAPLNHFSLEQLKPLLNPLEDTHHM